MADEIKYGGLDPVIPNQKVTDKTNTGNRWSSTGKGHFPDVRLRPKSPSDAYLILHTAGVQPSMNDDNRKNILRLWVHEFNIAWSMDYRSSQTAFGKSFYPRHARYPNITIKAQTASQAHYDEIVEKLLYFQSNAIVPGTTKSPTEVDIVRFYMPPAKFVNGRGERDNPPPKADPSGQHTYFKYNSVSFDGYPMAIRAGHTKGVYNPEIEISFAVISYFPDKDLMEAPVTPVKDYSQEFKNSIGKGYNLDGAKVSRGNPTTDSGYGEAFDAIPGGPGGNQG